MARSSKKSWRLKFIDIDSSYSITNNDSPIIGYFACRAPKGEQRAMYFPPLNGQAIDAMIGVPTANWPDIFEAKSFNEEYACYISAPPGSSTAYPSHLGGFYVSRDGIYKFWDVSSKDELKEGSGRAFIAKVEVGKENKFSRRISESSEQFSSVILALPEVDPSYVNPTDEWVQFINTAADTEIRISPPTKLPEPSFIQYDAMKNGKVDMATGSVVAGWGTPENGFDFVNDPTYGPTAVLPYFGYTTPADKAVALKTWLGQEIYDLLVDDPLAVQPLLTADGIDNLRKLIKTGFFTLPDGPDDDDEPDIYTIPFDIGGLFMYGVNVADQTYAYFMQKSCTEKKTSITISDIGYDKYIYDNVFPYAKVVITTDGFQIDWTGSILTPAEQQTVMDSYEEIASCDSNGEYKMILRKIDRLTASDPIFWEDVTGEFMTKRFVCFKPITGVKILKAERTVNLIQNATTIIHLYTEEELQSDYGIEEGLEAYVKMIAAGTAAPKDWRFNTIRISSSESVYPGVTTSGGEFLGSLDEQGKDSYGSNIYFPEMLTADDFSFIEVDVVRPFNDSGRDLVNGFWIWDRVIDPFDIDNDAFKPTDKRFTIEGDRYADIVVQMNTLMGLTGGIWRNEWLQFINDALDEALVPDYDDAFIFVEPTGQEMFKNKLMAVRREQNMATVISPKILRPSSKGIYTDTIAQKEIVNGRMEGTAQFAGEFEVYDSITYKKYYRQPIGDVACNLARIMERKLGGWAPAWTNITGGLGGQLKTVCRGSRYVFEDLATKTLDKKGINPIIYTADEGVMILSHKSTKDPANLSDWNFLGHSMSFDMVKREIRDNVMIPQVLKPISEYWMGIRQTQVETILAKRTAGMDPIWSFASCDIKGVNTRLTKLEKKFCIKVQVRVYPYSETVELTLENLAQ